MASAAHPHMPTTSPEAAHSRRSATLETDPNKPNARAPKKQKNKPTGILPLIHDGRLTIVDFQSSGSSSSIENLPSELFAVVLSEANGLRMTVWKRARQRPPGGAERARCQASAIASLFRLPLPPPAPSPRSYGRWHARHPRSSLPSACLGYPRSPSSSPQPRHGFRPRSFLARY